MRELTDGRGVDVVMESVGGEVLRAALNGLAKNGRVVTVGGHGGEVVPVDVILLFRNQWSLIGSVRATAEELRHVVDMAGRGEIRPVLDSVHPLEDAAGAHRLMEARRQYGKIVLAP